MSDKLQLDCDKWCVTHFPPSLLRHPYFFFNAAPASRAPRRRRSQVLSSEGESLCLGPFQPPPTPRSGVWKLPAVVTPTQICTELLPGQAVFSSYWPEAVPEHVYQGAHNPMGPQQYHGVFGPLHIEKKGVDFPPKKCLKFLDYSQEFSIKLSRKLQSSKRKKMLGKKKKSSVLTLI